jgi:hypothetical protein
MSWTYAIQSIGGGPVKIGSTAGNPAARLSALQTGNPERLQIIWRMRNSRHERWFHNRYAHARLSGEWFADHIITDLLSHVLCIDCKKMFRKAPGAIDLKIQRCISCDVEHERDHGVYAYERIEVA